MNAKGIWLKSEKVAVGKGHALHAQAMKQEECQFFPRSSEK